MAATMAVLSKSLKKLGTLGALTLGLLLANLSHAQTSLKIMPFGDSITAGGYNLNGAYYTGSGYRQTLWNLIQTTGLNASLVGQFQDGSPGFTENHHEGHAGFRIDQISAGAVAWVAAQNPDVILLLIGTNDCIQNYDLPNAMNRMQTLLTNIQTAAPRVQVFIATTIRDNYPNMPEVQGRVLQYNQALTTFVQAKAATDAKIHFVDLYTLQNSDLMDGVHPTSAAYAVLGQVWFNALKQAHIEGLQ
jgi:acyl-CoA thioesterase-1